MLLEIFLWWLLGEAPWQMLPVAWKANLNSFLYWWVLQNPWALLLESHCLCKFKWQATHPFTTINNHSLLWTQSANKTVSTTASLLYPSPDDNQTPGSTISKSERTRVQLSKWLTWKLLTYSEIWGRSTFTCRFFPPMGTHYISIPLFLWGELLLWFLTYYL